MKTKDHHHSRLATRLAAAPLIALLAFSGVGQAQEPKPAPQAAGTFQAAIEHKLRTIVLPSVDFDNTSIEEAVDFIRTESKVQDKAESDETRKGVSFWIQGKKGFEFPRVTLKLKNVTVGEALNSVAKLTNTVPKITGSSVALMPKDSAAAAESDAPVPGAMAAAKQTTIALIDIDGEPLDKVVEFLNKESAANKGPKVVIGDGLDPKSTVKSLRLKGATLAEAVYFLGQDVPCKCVATEDTLRLLPR
jgi:hypothetical protein